MSVGQALPFKIYTHHGFDFRGVCDRQLLAGITHDASLRLWLRPWDDDVLTEEVAVFRFETQGAPSSVSFVRNETPKPERGCD